MKYGKLFLFVFTALIVCGCNGIEGAAKKQLRESLKHKALDPSTVKISEEKVVFKNDSLCVIDFVVRQSNANGGMDRADMEYKYGRFHDGTFEDFIYTGGEPWEKRIAKEIKSNEDFIYVLSNKSIRHKYSAEDIIDMECHTGEKIE